LHLTASLVDVADIKCWLHKAQVWCSLYPSYILACSLVHTKFWDYKKVKQEEDKQKKEEEEKKKKKKKKKKTKEKKMKKKEMMTTKKKTEETARKNKK
jgi:mannitol-specific phosphotransferase system IIBC component